MRFDLCSLVEDFGLDAVNLVVGEVDLLGLGTDPNANSLHWFSLFSDRIASDLHVLGLALDVDPDSRCTTAVFDVVDYAKRTMAFITKHFAKK